MRVDYAETRFVTMAPINNRLCVFAWHQRGERGEKETNMKRPYIKRDGEVRELDQEFFATAKRGRPSMPAEAKKRRVNIMLDPDVADRLKAIPNVSAYVNDLLRKKLVA